MVSIGYNPPPILVVNHVVKPKYKNNPVKATIYQYQVRHSQSELSIIALHLPATVHGNISLEEGGLVATLQGVSSWH